MGHLSCITYPPSPLFNVGKYGVFSNKKRKNRLITNIESVGRGENLLGVPTLLSGIVGRPHVQQLPCYSESTEDHNKYLSCRERYEDIIDHRYYTVTQLKQL